MLTSRSPERRLARHLHRRDVLPDIDVSAQGEFEQDRNRVYRHKSTEFDAMPPLVTHARRHDLDLSDRSALPRTARGFTLVELVVTVAVVAISLTLGVPSFQGIMSRNKIATASNDVLLGLHAAKSEAIRQNAAIRFCLNPSSRSWSVKTMAGTDIRVGALSDQVSITSTNLDTASVTDNACVRFRSDGLSYSTGSTLITAGSVTLSLGGNTRVVHVKTGALNVASS
jgi:type IV fimbrial biogenesis protein FimT